MHDMAVPPHNTRIGIHYFPDTFHFREIDLTRWLPELKALGVGWLTIQAPHERAIPEFFIRSILEEDIQPILHFHSLKITSHPFEDFTLLFENYARWGIRYIALFNSPNVISSWPISTWARGNLVERFLDIYLPLAEAAMTRGLTSVFPPLEPGGDYWDTSFLRASIQGMQRRNKTALLDQLILGGYAWASNKSLDWGIGGSERWPKSRPYDQPADTEDQKGFRIFDWYLEIAQCELHKPVPIMLLKAGCCPGDQTDPGQPAVDLDLHAQRNLMIAQLMADEETISNPVPAEVINCNFWVLSTSSDSSHKAQAWFQPGQQPLPVVDILKAWYINRSRLSSLPASAQNNPTQGINTHPIDHYLLLPTYEWGVADWHLEAIRPFIKKYHPTVGFSVSEAALARRVTILGGPQFYPESVSDHLVTLGCIVQRVSGDGTDIATALASM